MQHYSHHIGLYPFRFTPGAIPADLFTTNMVANHNSYMHVLAEVQWHI